MNSKSITFAASVVLWLGLASGSLATASVQSGDIIKLSDGPGGPGGIFYVTEVPADPTSYFPTFCVQLTEFISLGAEYKAVFNDHTVGGNVPLSSTAAWLYTSFLRESSLLTGFDYGKKSPAYVADTTAINQANAIQLGIWLNMMPSSVVGDVAKAEFVRDRAGWTIDYINSLKSTYLNSWLANYALSGWADTNYTGAIRIVNIYDKDSSGLYTVNKQDQLVEVTPEPADLLVWGGLTSVALAAAIRRNRQHS